MKTIPFVEKQLRGLDLSADAESIGTGFFVRADNVVLDGPDFVVRPGKRGQLSAATGNAMYALEPFPSGSTSSSLFVSNSKLYKWTLGATSVTEILDGSGTSLGTARAITVADAFIARSLNLAYLVDGTATMYRVNLTDARAITSLNRPSPPSAAVASDYQIDDGGTYTNWVNMDGATSSSLLANGSFESGSSSGGVIASPSSWSEFETGFGWDSVDNTVSSITAADSTYMARLDRPGEARYQRITPETLSNPDGAHKVCRHFVLDAKVHSRDAAGLSSVVFQLSALDSSNIPMSVRTFEAQPAKPSGTTSTDWVSYSFGAGFTDIDTDPTSIEIAILAGDQNTATVYVDKVTLYDASVYPFTFDGPATGFDVYLNATTSATSGRTKYLQTQGNLAGYVNGLYIYRDLGSEQAMSYKYFKAKIKIAKQIAETNPEFTLRLGFKRASGGIYWSAPGYYRQDSDYMFFDCSNIDPTVLAASRYIYLQCYGDQQGGVGPSTLLYSFDGLFGVGGLSGGVPYWYKLVEMNSNSDADFYDVIESDTSNPTPLVSLPDEGGMVKVALPARTNSSADYLLLVRFGGTLVESERGKVPFGYVVAVIAWSATSFAYGANTALGVTPYEKYRANPHIQWTKTGSTGDAGSIILDSTPDAWLAHQEIVKEGKDNPPSAPSDVCVWRDRVWLSKDAEIWGSWALSADKAAGLYYSRIVLPSENDPHAPIKGYFERLQLAAGDTIQRIISYGRQVLVFTKLSLWVGTGDDALSFSFRELPDSPGLVAKRAVTVFRGVCYFLGPDGLYAWDGSKVFYVGEKLRRALYPQSVPGGLPHDPASLAKSFMVSGGRFLFLGVPETGAVGGNIDPSYTASNQNGASGALSTVPNSGSATANLSDGSTTTKEEASSVSFPDHRTTAFMDFGEDVVLSSWEATVRCFQLAGSGTGTYAVDYATSAAPTSWTSITSGSLAVSTSANYSGAIDQALSGSISGTGRYVRITLLHVGAAEGGVAISECDSEANSSSNPTALYCLSATGDKVNGWTKFTDFSMTGGAAFESPLDSADFVFTGTDGQLYRLQGTGDRATSGGSVTSVTPYLTTRQFGDRSVRLAPGRFTWGLTHEAETSTTFSLAGDGPTWSKTRVIPAGDYNSWTRASISASGRLLQASCSFSTTGASRISNFLLEAAPTRMLR